VELQPCRDFYTFLVQEGVYDNRSDEQYTGTCAPFSTVRLLTYKEAARLSNPPFSLPFQLFSSNLTNVLHATVERPFHPLNRVQLTDCV
jgi:hypothetical protein